MGFPRADTARFEAAFPRHETVEVDADHFFFEDARAEMVARIRRFVPSGATAAAAPEGPRR